MAAITVMASSQPRMWSPAAIASVAPWGSKSLACPSAGAGISTSRVYLVFPSYAARVSQVQA